MKRTILMLGIFALATSWSGDARAQCLNNIVANGDFTNGLVPGSMPPATAANWSQLSASPQVLDTLGCAAPGSLQMWGNLVVGESVKQTLPGSGIQAGKRYRASLAYLERIPGPNPADEVSVRLAMSNVAPTVFPPLAAYDYTIGVTPLTTSTSCITHRFPIFTAPTNASYVTLNPENDSSVNDGAFVSWALVDDLCIQEAVLEHFSGYAVKPTKGSPKPVKFGPIVLQDQFGSAKYIVGKPRELLLPANKNDEGLLDSDTHLKEYQVKPLSALTIPSAVQITNQCNDTVIEVRKVRSLLVPTSKTPPPGAQVPDAPDPAYHNVDHFLCYQAKAAKSVGGVPQAFPKGTQVNVVDQFQTRRYDLRRITKLCNPVAKSTDPQDPPKILSGADAGTDKAIAPAAIRNPEDHLVCYQAKLAKKLIPQSGCGCDTVADPKCAGTALDPVQPAEVVFSGVQVNNQFGPETLDTGKHVEICIPSHKTLLP
jgi:hypothetical protein